MAQNLNTRIAKLTHWQREAFFAACQTLVDYGMQKVATPADVHDLLDIIVSGFTAEIAAALRMTWVHDLAGAVEGKRSAGLIIQEIRRPAYS